jgi:hypothetical protein
MEAVIENAPKAVVAAASNPVRSDTRFMANGDVMPDDPGAQQAVNDWAAQTNSDANSDALNTPAASSAGAPAAKQSWLQRYLASGKKPQPQTMPGQAGWNKTTPYQQIGEAVGTAARVAAPYLADGEMMAGGHMGGGFHWSSAQPRMPETPHMQERAGYQPLAYRAKPMLADGAAPIDLNGAQVGSAKVFNRPTMVNLKRGDTVVPLTYRPKAKVRPSTALPALKQRSMYGVSNAA